MVEPNARILPENVVPELSRAVEASIGSMAVGLATKLGVSIEDTIRFFAVSQRCIAARTTAGWNIKEVARRLRVPQYQIRGIESGDITQIKPGVLGEYLRLLGLSGWYADWSCENRALATRLEKQAHSSSTDQTRDARVR
jgi:hypothetical protein